MSLPSQDDTHKKPIEPTKTPPVKEQSGAGLAQRELACSENDTPFARAANEDDDGYDPWSDRREEPELWEEDPWR